MKLKLRQYQINCISALWAAFRRTPYCRPLLCCPVGSGKSLLIAEIVRAIVEKKKDWRVLVVAHRKEIVGQNAAEFQALTGLPVGIVSAGLGKKDRQQITFANIQSLFRTPGEWELIICDECHLISQNDGSMYQKLLNANLKAKVVGLTATPMRLDRSVLVGEGGVFSEIAYNITMQELIAQGYLAPLVSVQREGIPLLDVRMVGGDFSQGDVERNAMPDVHVHAAEIKRHTADRNRVLVFCAGVKHAHAMAEALGGELITGETLAMERDMRIERFKRGEFKYLINIDVLTVGFNVPSIDCIALVRATTSMGLYIQAVGRGSRVAEGKKDCKILDFGGNILRHGPVDLIEIKEKRQPNGEYASVPPLKSCDECGCVCGARCEECPLCGNVFPIKAKLSDEPSPLPVLSQNTLTCDVVDMHLSVHQKAGGKSSLRIQFLLESGDTVNSFLCFNHGGWPAEKARDMWRKLSGGSSAPATSEAAYHRGSELRTPARVLVEKNGKWWNLKKVLGFKEPVNASLWEA